MTKGASKSISLTVLIEDSFGINLLLCFHCCTRKPFLIEKPWVYLGRIITLTSRYEVKLEYTQNTLCPVSLIVTTSVM